jgi:hypothetical protein
MTDRRDRHLSIDLLARCLAGHGDRSEQRWVVRHLLTGCERCRKLAALTFMLAALREDDFLPAGSPGDSPPLLFTCKPANAKNQ